MTMNNSVVLITGASLGLGRELAISLAEKGAVLILAGRNLKKLIKTANKITSRFPNIEKPLCVACDVTEKSMVKELVEKCIKEKGRIDILINNAGIGVYGDFRKMSIDDFKSVMNVNYFGAINCILSVIPFMQQKNNDYQSIYFYCILVMFF